MCHLEPCVLSNAIVRAFSSWLMGTLMISGPPALHLDNVCIAACNSRMWACTSSFMDLDHHSRGQFLSVLAAITWKPELPWFVPWEHCILGQMQGNRNVSVTERTNPLAPIVYLHSIKGTFIAKEPVSNSMEFCHLLLIIALIKDYVFSNSFNVNFHN